MQFALTSPSKFTDPESQSNQFTFGEYFIKTPRFNLILARLSNNTFVMAILPPGEAELNCARINIANARHQFFGFDPLQNRSARVLQPAQNRQDDSLSGAARNLTLNG